VSLFLFRCQTNNLSYLVAQALGGNDGDLIADSLVGLEVQSQLGVVTLNDDLGGLLDSLCRIMSVSVDCNYFKMS
jgi:hypothetical protein